MSEPTHLSDKRWERSSRPQDHKPADALQQVLRQLGTGGEYEDVEHIIVCIGRPSPDNPGAKRLSYAQAGGYNHLEQIGLLDSIKHMMNE